VPLDDPSLTPDEVQPRLHDLFEAAKQADEFEFGCTLLRVRGMETAGWDPFVETSHLVEDLMALIGAPLVGHTKVRLGLLLYSHLTEAVTIYAVLGNLTRVVRGERYVMDPFLDAYPRNRKGEPQASTPVIVRALREMLTETGHAPVSELFDWFFVSGLRNAFAHADYTLHGDKFRCRSESFEVGGILTPEISLDLIADILNRALGFYGAFMEEYEARRRGYRSNKIVLGRLAGDEPIPVELVADETRGLYGFQSPPGDEHGSPDTTTGGATTADADKS
jgi:hypothetical protein